MPNTLSPSNIIAIINYLKYDLIKHQSSFKIGLFSIFLVIVFISILQNFIQLSSIIFIRVCEDSVSEADYTFVPKIMKFDSSSIQSVFNQVIDGSTNNALFSLNLLDFDYINNVTKGIPFLKGVAPRWVLRGNATMNNTNTLSWGEVNIFILDSLLENTIGMGRSLNWKQWKENECYISESLSKSLKIDFNKHKNISLNIKLSNWLSMIGGGEQSDLMANLTTDVSDDSEISQNWIIKQWIHRLDIHEITLSKAEIMKQLNLPKNFSISTSFLDSRFMEFIPILKEFKAFINSNSTLKDQIFNITDEKITFNNIEDDALSIPFNWSAFVEGFTDEEIEEIASFKVDLKIKEIVKQTSGKWPSAAGNVVAFDSKFINSYWKTNLIRVLKLISKDSVSAFMINVLNKYLSSNISNFNINKYALIVNGVANNKFEIYSKTHNNQRVFIGQQTSAILQRIGVEYPFTITTPIYTAMEAMEIGKVFLENIFISIMLFLYMWSVILIYSLLLGNVDERTYEFGLLRSLGFKKDSLTWMIILQGLIFAVPGIALGWMTSYVINNYIALLLNWFSGWVIPFFWSRTTVISGVFIGLSIPLISSYFPIKKSLESNWKETLTIFNKKIGDLVVTMIKLENYGVSATSVIASWILISMGFATYYLAPLSFLLMNPAIFLFIMMLILLMMLLGWLIISQLIIPSIQKVILKIIMRISYKDSHFHIIVMKNWEGHARRNQKVSWMFMIALGFIIFSGCTLNLIVSFVENIAKTAIGGDCAYTIWHDIEKSPTWNQKKLSNYLNRVTREYPGWINNYTFVSYWLSHILDDYIYLSSLNGYPKEIIPIVTIDETYLESTYYSDWYEVNEYDKRLNYTMLTKWNQPDIVRMMYLNDNVDKILSKSNEINFPSNEKIWNSNWDIQLNLVVNEGVKRWISVDVDNPAKMEITWSRDNHKIPCKIMGVASKMPGQFMVSNPTIAMKFPVYISNKQVTSLFEKLSKQHSNIRNKLLRSLAHRMTPDNVPKQGWIVKFNNDYKNDTLKDMIYFELKNWAFENKADSFYLADIIGTAEKIAQIWEYVFLVLGLISFIWAFFLIWISFYASIKENICEYGIFRAVGIRKQQWTRIFLYETGTIILSSIITGTFIGVVISISLILQFNIFAELPFKFNFPIKWYSVQVVCGLWLGMIGSYYPTYEVNKKSLVTIMKGMIDY